MNALYLVLIAIGFSAGILVSVFSHEKSQANIGIQKTELKEIETEAAIESVTEEKTNFFFKF